MRVPRLGGRLAILAERNPAAAIVALDVHPHRTRLLRERVQAANVEVATADLRSFAASEKFDRVLVGCTLHRNWDAGASSRNQVAAARGNIVELQTLQVELVQAAMRQVAHGGTLLYSTCSLEPEECEQVVEGAMREATGKEFELGSISKELSRLQDNKILTVANVERLTQGQYLRDLPRCSPVRRILRGASASALVHNQ